LGPEMKREGAKQLCQTLWDKLYNG